MVHTEEVSDENNTTTFGSLMRTTPPHLGLWWEQPTFGSLMRTTPPHLGLWWEQH